MAVLTKEPFLIAVLPWLALTPFIQPLPWPTRLRRSLALFAGSALVGGSVIAWLILNQAWDDYLGVLAFNQAYASQTRGAFWQHLVKSGSFVRDNLLSGRFALQALLSAGLLWSCFVTYRRRGEAEGRVAATLLAFAICSLAAASLSGFAFRHYYLLCVPSIALVFGAGCKRSLPGWAP